MQCNFSSIVRCLLLAFFVTLTGQFLSANVPDDQPVEAIRFSDYDTGKYLDRIRYFEDVEGTMTIDDMIHQTFHPGKPGVQNMGVSPSIYWFKIRLYNDHERDEFVFVIDNSLLNHVTLYQSDLDSSGAHRYRGEVVSKYENHSDRLNKSTMPEFHVRQPVGSTETYYLRVESYTQLLIPIKVQSHP